MLAYVGLIEGDGSPPIVPFMRRDGSPGRINRHVDVIHSGPPPAPDAPIVLQASRWDGMKDMPGVMQGFAEHVDPSLGAHLILAGPAVSGVADDPEAAQTFDDCVSRWHQLPARHPRPRAPRMRPDDRRRRGRRDRQRPPAPRNGRLQKSLAEGFGLTVTEAMWKTTPVVASAVGGIVDQIVDGEHGLLIDDPHDLTAFGEAVEHLLREPTDAQRLAHNARQRAAAEFLGDRHLEQWYEIFQGLR